MQVVRLFKLSLPFAIIVGSLLFSCINGGNGVFGGGEGEGTSDDFELYPACDPDGVAPCSGDWFVCTGEGENKHCEGQVPAVPDGGDWDCEEQGTTLICTGDHFPDGGDWQCEEIEEGVVECRRHAYVPEGGGDETWNCWYEGEFRICESGGGGGSEGGDDPPETGTNGCLCVAGAWRYCDTPTYCRWGIQYCADDGMSWGTCEEIQDIPLECVQIDGWYSPNAQQCCVDNNFCCQDMWDIDRDGDTWESLGNCTDIVCE